MESAQAYDVKISNFESVNQSNLCALVDTLLPKNASFVSQSAQIKSDRQNEDFAEFLLCRKEDEELITARKSRAERVMRSREVEDRERDHAQACLTDDGAVRCSQSTPGTSNTRFSQFSAWRSLNYSSLYWSS